MRPFAIWLEMTRGADAPGMRNVVLPVRRLHEASPTGPGSPGSEPLCPGCGVLPEAILRCPGLKKCPYCPYFSTPPRDWGPPNSVVRSHTRFYTSGSALRHSRSSSLFRHFGRENFAVMPKEGALLFTIATGLSPTRKTKIQKGGMQILGTGARRYLERVTRLWAGNKILRERER